MAVAVRKRITEMRMLVTKEIEFDVEALAENVIDHLYGELEYGSLGDDWRCLTLDQQEELIEAILKRAVEKRQEGE